MRITNQKPVRLEPMYNDNTNQAFAPIELLNEIAVTPLFTPVTPNHPVVLHKNGVDLTETDISNTLQSCLNDTLDMPAEQDMKDIFSQTLLTFNGNTKLIIQDLFMIQSGTAAKLPEPSDKVIYTPGGDVIPACKQFIAGQCDYDYFFATLGYYTRSKTLGFYFINENIFNDFIAWFSQQMITIGSALPPETTKAAADFQKLTLTNLTESLLLRNNPNENNDPNSFARLIVRMLMNYTKVAGSGLFGILPFHLSDVICPITITFVNVERHSRATTKQVADEWKIINQSIQKKPVMISNKALMKLTAQARNLQKITNAANAAINAGFKKGGSISRTKNIKFRKTPPTSFDLARTVMKIINKMEFVNQSMNIFRTTTTTFAKPNRRDPDDWNKKGKATRTNFKPDIHIYIDTSGSISEIHYQETIKMLIRAAKKLNINIYFNSFSHYMSETSRLELKNKNIAQIYAEFQKIPKVHGGTDFEQIWHFINSSKKRSLELSIMITDFEWTAPSEFIKHPKNLYYMPCSNKDWNDITKQSKYFCDSMLHNDPNIRTHLLF